MEDKEIERALVGIETSMKAITKTDLVLMMQWLKGLEKRVESLEKRQKLWYRLQNFLIEFLIAIILFFIFYFVSRM